VTTLLFRVCLQSNCNAAIKAWEAKHEAVAEEAEVVKLYCQIPPIAKMDNSLNTLKCCTHLSLSTNGIDRLIPLSGMKELRILSIGRNHIKKLEKLDDLADTLEELWVSYNSIASLDGVAGLKKLQVLYISNNLIKSWSELDHLVTHHHAPHTTRHTCSAHYPPLPRASVHHHTTPSGWHAGAEGLSVLREPNLRGSVAQRAAHRGAEKAAKPREGPYAVVRWRACTLHRHRLSFCDSFYAPSEDV
jgi:dynein light chain 1